MAELPDTRYQPFVTYDKAFLMWLGLGVFLFRLGARRQLDYELGGDPEQDEMVLGNVNRFANTDQSSLPVHRTLAHDVTDHLGWEPVAQMRTAMARRLIRMKGLDSARLLGHVVVGLDGTGHLAFRRQHCDHCLVQEHGDRSYYYHQVLEAKRVGPSGLAVSVGTEFIDNTLVGPRPADSGEQEWKQDCELKAFQRLAPELKQALPQTRLCISGGNLYGCGPAMTVCEEHGWRYVFTFKPGRTPELWAEFQALKDLSLERVVRLTRPDGVVEEYRWVNDLLYTDASGREHQVAAIESVALRDGEPISTWAWLTNFRVSAKNVMAIANQGGRPRSTIENEGFNVQKNGGYRLEHAYSYDEVGLRVFYILLQIAHAMMPVFERGSLLKGLAIQVGKRTLLDWYGSYQNLSRRLLEFFRNRWIAAEAFDVEAARRIQIRFDSS